MARLSAGVKKATPTPPRLQPAQSKQATTPRLNAAPSAQAATPRLQHAGDFTALDKNYIQPNSGPVYTNGGTLGGAFDGSIAADPMNSLLEDVPTPAIPNANSEATYQSQMAQLAQMLADSKAQDQLLRSQYNTNYGDSLRTLGWNNDANSFDPNNRQGYYGQAYGGLWDDFASRGTLNSGSFGDALSNLSNEFGQRKTGLDTARTQYLAAQDQNMQSVQNQNQSAGQDYLMQAVARLAQLYGVDPSQVPRG